MGKSTSRHTEPVKISKNSQYVKISTLYLTALICLLIGFLGGTVLTVYKLDQTPAPPKSAPHAAPRDGAMDEQKIKKLEQDVHADPANLTAWIDLGNIYFDTNQFSKSIHAYQKALAIDPNNADVWTDLGIMFRRSGQPKKAIEAFDQAIKIAPAHEISRFNKGIVLLHDLNNPQAAIEAWEGLLSVNPNATAPNGQSVKSLVEMFKERLQAKDQP
jgi:cytochrome c-type biogenesis protein CcmH/NrfG